MSCGRSSATSGAEPPAASVISFAAASPCGTPITLIVNCGRSFLTASKRCACNRLAISFAALQLRKFTFAGASACCASNSRGDISPDNQGLPSTHRRLLFDARRLNRSAVLQTALPHGATDLEAGQVVVQSRPRRRRRLAGSHGATERHHLAVVPDGPQSAGERA